MAIEWLIALLRLSTTGKRNVIGKPLVILTHLVILALCFVELSILHILALVSKIVGFYINVVSVELIITGQLIAETVKLINLFIRYWSFLIFFNVRS